jgi:short-subunit dehydrogenase
MGNKLNKTILITGATSGIGRHAAFHLAGLGHRVLATGRSATKLEALAAEVAGTNLTGRIDTLPLDVTDSDSIAAAHESALKLTHGRGVDVLLNNAGFGHAAPCELVTDEELRAQFETNVFGLMSVTRAFLPHLKRNQGRLINVSSVGGRVSFPLFGAYNATKYALESLSDAMRNELKVFGVDVILIEPGPIKTGFSDVSASIAASYEGRGGAYEPIIARAAELRAMADKLSVAPIVVSRAIERAVVSRRPRARYIAPFWSALMLGFFTVLPTRMSDWVMRQSLGMTSKGLLSGAA